jgi:hypothetical protein
MIAALAAALAASCGASPPPVRTVDRPAACEETVQGVWQETEGAPPAEHVLVMSFTGRLVTLHRDGKLRFVGRISRCEPGRLVLSIPVEGTVVMGTARQADALTLTMARRPPRTLRRLDHPPVFPPRAPAPLGRTAPLALARLAALRAELIRRGELDQDVRRDAARRAEIPAVDADNLGYVGQLLREVGWIDVERFGLSASVAAFLIVLHSGDLPLMLAAQQALWKDHTAGHPVGRYYASLDDKVRLMQGYRQRYGSSLGEDERGGLVVLPLEDRARVDAWRKEVGLPPLAEYLEVWRAANGGRPIGFADLDLD